MARAAASGGRGRGRGRGRGTAAAANVNKSKGKRKADTTEAAELSPRSKRRVGRRETEEQAERVLTSGKLDHVPKSMWLTKKNKSGKTVKQFTEDWIRKHRQPGTTCRCSTQFWCSLFASFGLTSSIVLREPTDQRAPDDECLEAMACLLHENPVKANPVPLIEYFSRVDSLSEMTTYGLLTALQCGPKLNRNNAAKVHVAILSMWARTFRVCPTTPFVTMCSEQIAIQITVPGVLDHQASVSELMRFLGQGLPLPHP